MKYENKEAFEQVNMFGTGTPNTAYSKFFIGDAFLNPLTAPKGSLFAANVTFEPACLHRGRGLVSGRGQGRRQPARGQRHHDPREREALAWREKGQLVQPHRR